MQETFEDATGVTVETVFLHESGETLRGGRLHVPASKQDPQGYGSALTYARRYSLQAACGIAPEDDDGNAASKATQARKHAAPAMGDDSPKARALRIIAGVAAGDAVGAAAAIASWEQALIDEVWQHFDPTTADAINANWPKE
jgi:ERF superfamily